MEILQWFDLSLFSVIVLSIGRFVHEGDHVKQFQKVCEVQSDKATVEISSRFDGMIKKLHYAKSDVAKVGKPLLDIDVPDSVGNVSSPAPPPARQCPVEPSAAAKTVEASNGTYLKDGKALATPAVRRLANENNVELNVIAGSGKMGRVTKEDILKIVEHRGSSGLPSASPARGNSSFAAEDRVIPVRGYQRTMIKTMTEALKIPHFGYSDEVSLDLLVDCRNNLKKTAADRGIKLTFMAFFLKAASIALLRYPILNSQLAPSGNEIVLKGDHNIGVAIDTPQGLVVPNIKAVQRKSVFEIATELSTLQDAAKKAHLPMDALTGGTFTLSNIGSVGGTSTSPIIVVPEVCIGAIGKAQTLPRFNDEGDVVAKTILTVSWSADHRVVDGATMARFSNVWKEMIENPMSMIAEMR